jgi:hypothetical protein
MNLIRSNPIDGVTQIIGFALLLSSVPVLIVTLLMNTGPGGKLTETEQFAIVLCVTLAAFAGTMMMAIGRWGIPILWFVEGVMTLALLLTRHHVGWSALDIAITLVAVTLIWAPGMVLLMLWQRLRGA